MKHILKTAGSLLLDQFLGVFSGWMLVVCVSVLFKNSLTGYVIAFCICFGFYSYITYNTAFKSGFRDPNRLKKDPAYRDYWYKGAVAGAISAIPVAILYVAFLITNALIVYSYFMIFNMYWTWPMANIFPNHRPLVMALAFLPMILIPWVGYIAGYKNFMISDVVVKLWKKYAEKKKDDPQSM